ncbi:MAG: hypothetical protein RIQ46_1163 [Pseudomonadota bacterium]
MRCRRGATAAEFAMVLPLALLLLFGIFDTGRYAWDVNQAEKAVQMGARYAVATALVADGLNSWELADYNTYCGGDLRPGDPVCRAALGQISCTGTGSGATCRCDAAPCPDVGAVNDEAFAAIVARMRYIMPRIAPENVTVRYAGSGLGFAGDPSVDGDGNPLSDIAPVVTVQVHGLTLRTMTMFGGEIALPRAASSLTLEDGDGARAY